MKSFIYKTLCFFGMLCVLNIASAQDIISRGGTLTVNRDNGGGPNAGEGSLKVIDNNTASKFLINPFVSPLLIQFECNAPAMAAQYSMTSGGDAPERDPKDWRLEGSANGTDWVLLDSRTNQTFSGRGQTRIFDVASPAEYKFYRLNITAISSPGLFQLAEWRLLEGQPPAAPTELQGSVLSGGNILLTWKRNANNDASTIIEKSTDGVSFVTAATVNPTPTNFMAGDLQPNTNYHFRVKSVNRFGESAASNVLMLQTKSQSSELKSITQDGGKLTVLLEHSSGPTAGEGSPKLIDNNNSTKYLPLNAPFPPTGLWFQYEATVAYIPSAYTIVTGNDATDRDPRSWRFEGSNDGQNWTVLDTKANINIPQRNFEAFYPVSTTEAFKFFRLFVTQNNGSTSTVASFQLSEWRVWGINPDAPIVPTNFRITGRTITEVSLAWDAAGSGGVDIQRSEDGVSFAVVDSVAGGITTFTDNDLFGGTQYWYRIRSKGKPTNSVWTDTASIFTDWDPLLPLTPRELMATPLSENSIEISWSDRSENETGFDIERSANGSLFTKIATVNADVTEYLDEDAALTLATRYWYRIRAINGNGTSFYSNIADAITLGQNTAPSFDLIADTITCSASKQYTIPVTSITTGNESWQNVTLSVLSSEQGVLSQLDVSAINNGSAEITFTGRGPRTPRDTTIITVIATDNGGTLNGGKNTFSRTFRVIINPIRVSITANPGTQIARYSTTQLTASGAPNYAWDDSAGIISPLNGASITVKPTVNTTYKVTGSNAEGCTADTTITVQLSAGVLAEAVNILTPNGDGKNDRWIVWNINRYPENTVSVFDRSGRLVFRQRNYSNNWDGTFNGKPLQEGAYYYVIELGTGIEPLKGTLTLIRERK